MKRYRLSGAAESDLTRIVLDGLEQFGPVVTERYVGELEKVFDSLCRFPESARLRVELKPPVRVHAHGAHIIVYEVGDEDLIILRIRSARENWIESPLGDAV